MPVIERAAQEDDEQQIDFHALVCRLDTPDSAELSCHRQTTQATADVLNKHRDAWETVPIGTQKIDQFSAKIRIH